MFVWKRICVYVAIVVCLFFAFSGEVRAEKLPPPDLLSLTPEITSLEAPIDIQGVDFWTWRGPRYNLAAGAAPQVTTVVLDPNNPDIVYAGTNQGVYRSTDGGESWQPRNGGLGGYGDLVITGIAIDPTDSRILIIGTWGYGLLKSTDSGANWTRLGDPVRPTALAGVEEGLLPPPEVIAGGPSNVYYPEAAERNEIAAPISWQRTAVRCVTINPSNRNDIYACVDDGYGLYRSTNGGASWSKITLGTGSARTYTFAPSNNNVRYASFGTWTTSGGFFRSTNGGSTWTAVGGGVINNTVIAVAIHPTNANTVVVGTSGGGLYRTTDGGNTWTAVNTGVSDTTIYSVAISKINPNIVYAGGYMWVYRSTDGGASWANADSSFPAYYVEGLAIHPTSSDRVWIGINRFPWGGVYKRTTSTGAFTLKGAGMDGTFVLDVTQDLNNANTLYAATWGAGMFRSYDRGATWSAIYGVPYVYSIEATQGPTGTILYAGTFYSDWGVLKSWNQGNTWVEVSWSNPSYISFDIESIQGNTNKLVAATYNGIQYSNDGGVTWATPTGLTEGIVLHLCEFGNTGQLLAATYGGGLYYSNGGTSWAPRTSGMTGPYANYTYDVACSSTSGLAYAGAYQAYRTTNYGSSWTAMNTGLANDYVRALAIAPTGAVFAGLNTGGAYLAPAGTTTWQAINTGLGERRVRSMAVVASSPVKALAGTNGAGIWEFTLVRGFPPVYLPLVLRSYPPAGINGQVRLGGAAVSGVSLQLRYFNGSSWSTRATTTTDSNGRYNFMGIPSLSSGQRYYVLYSNPSTTSSNGRLWGWYGANITSYTSGTAASGGDFDIKDATMASPANGATVTLPATFSWNLRGVSGDRYRIFFYDPVDNRGATTADLGYVSQTTITGLPSGWPSGRTYYWWMWVCQDASCAAFGESFYERSVRINFTMVSGEEVDPNGVTLTEVDLPADFARVFQAQE